MASGHSAGNVFASGSVSRDDDDQRRVIGRNPYLAFTNNTRPLPVVPSAPITPSVALPVASHVQRQVR